MKRRDLIRNGAAAAFGVVAGAGLAAAAPNGGAGGPGARRWSPDLARRALSRGAGRQHRFKLDYAPHFGMFRNSAGEDLLDQLRFMHEQGFRSIEDNNMRTRPVDVQNAIGRELERLDMRMGVFVANSNGFGVPSFSSGDEEMRAQFLSDCRDSVEVAKRVNARWMTVVMGDLSPRLEMDY